MARAFISVGSNIEPEKNVARAVLALADRVVFNTISTVYLNESVERVGDPLFYNCVIEIETDLLPEILKRDVLESVESDLGRARSEDKNAPRTIDLDVIVYEDEGRLLEVDPDITKKAFIAVPLAEIAPDLVIDGCRMSDAAAQFSNHGMTALTEYTKLLRRSVFGG